MKYLIALLSVFFLSGCSWLEPTIVTQTKIIHKDIHIANHPKPVTMNGVKFYVVTEANKKVFEQRFLKEHPELVYVAVSIKDYENLAINIAELKRYIGQQKDIILYYEEALENNNTIETLIKE